MKSLLTFSTLMLGLAWAGITGCGPAGPSSTATGPVFTNNIPGISSPVTTTTAPLATSTLPPTLAGAPTPAELEEQQFALPNVPRLTVEQIFTLWDSNAPMLMIDVRPHEFYNDQHIPGARNIPNDGSKEQPVSPEALAQLKQLPKDRLLVFYCD
jgi:hypothetical protein